MSDGEPILRPATVEDAAAISALFAQALPDPWTEAMIAESLQHGCHGLVAPWGVSLRGVALLQLLSPEAELLQVAVAVRHRHHGIGRALVRGSLALAARAGAEAVFLEVRPSNEPALSLYLTEGFAQVGRRRGYYSDGEDALIMRRSVRYPLPMPDDPAVR